MLKRLLQILLIFAQTIAVFCTGVIFGTYAENRHYQEIRNDVLEWMKTDNFASQGSTMIANGCEWIDGKLTVFVTPVVGNKAWEYFNKGVLHNRLDISEVRFIEQSK